MKKSKIQLPYIQKKNKITKNEIYKNECFKVVKKYFEIVYTCILFAIDRVFLG